MISLISTKKMLRTLMKQLQFIFSKPGKIYYHFVAIFLFKQYYMIDFSISCPVVAGNNKRIAPTYSLRVVKGD